MEQQSTAVEATPQEKTPEIIAKERLTAWMDHKKLHPAKRDFTEEACTTIIGALVNGTIVIDDDNYITHRLVFPLTDKNNVVVDMVRYRPRLTMEQIQVRMKNTDLSDGTGIMLAYIGALTNISQDLVRRMDTEDARIGKAIASFFL